LAARGQPEGIEGPQIIKPFCADSMQFSKLIELYAKK
jgi:hypothetical protein